MRLQNRQDCASAAQALQFKAFLAIVHMGNTVIVLYVPLNVFALHGTQVIITGNIISLYRYIADPFMVAEDGKRCSDIGKLNLNNKNECRWAARNRRIGNRQSSKGAFNGHTFNQKGMAKGCSMDGEFRWNKHPVGERGGRSVCLRSGKCIPLIVMKWQIFPIFM